LDDASTRNCGVKGDGDGGDDDDDDDDDDEQRASLAYSILRLLVKITFSGSGQ